jgi:DNA-3-methyladenine glycosylase II
MSKPKAIRPLSQSLPYKPPYDWESLLAVFRAHQLPHLEAVDELGYERAVRLSHDMGWFRVTHDAAHGNVKLQVWNGNQEDLASVAGQVRRMFDLDAEPQVIEQAMSQDRCLHGLWRQHPGLRVARSWNGYESMLTTILGQVVSVRFGRVLTQELMVAAGTKTRHPKSGETIYLFPTAKQLVKADLSTVRTSEARRIAIRSLAAMVAGGTLKWEQPMAHDALREVLMSVAGIGPWTAEYVAMRGFHDNDAFPSTDYGLKQVLKQFPQIKVDRVRPWRAYAAMALWKSYTG